MRGYLFLLYTIFLEGCLDIEFTYACNKCVKYNVFGLMAGDAGETGRRNEASDIDYR